MALTLTRNTRHTFAHAPEQFRLASEPVEFPSRVDATALRGWLLQPETVLHRRPVIMVHGKGADREAGPGDGILGISAPLVREGYRVLTFDLRASGESGGDRFTLGALEVRDVGGAIDFLRSRGMAMDGVSLVGFSMGGATALLVAESEPLVHAVVEDSGYADLNDLLDDQVPKQSGLPAVFTPGMVLAANGLLGINVYAIRPIDGVPALAAAGVPLLVIHGDADTYVPPKNARRIAAAYGPAVETLYLPEANHIESHWRAPATYNARLSAFLARTE
jgi:pimeloyl-ACP methyl ester carboxylesterase